MVLNVGLVGCGKIAERHAAILSSGQVVGAGLGGVTDLIAERRDKFSQIFQTKSFQTAEDLAASPDIDILSILTPSGCHVDDIRRLAPFGKPIVVEKPLALRLSEADEIIEICDHFDVKLFVVKQNRFNKPIIELRKAIDGGRFGKLTLGTVRLRWCRRQSYYDQALWRGTWQFDGGVLTNQASHHIDLLIWMMGEVESVFAKSTHALASIEAEDTAVVLLKFTNGALGIIEATTATRPVDLEGSLSILGEKASVVVGGFAANELTTWEFEHSGEYDAHIKANSSRNPENVNGYAHQRYYEHVVDCVSNNRQQLVDGLAGRKSLELISAIYESIETGKEVFLRFSPRHCRLGEPPASDSGASQ